MPQHIEINVRAPFPVLLLSNTQLKRFPSLYFPDSSWAIKLSGVKIPPHAIRGQDAQLHCDYNLEGDKLYSIKWYRNGHEFYRYIPTDNPKTTIFNGNGINVDVSIKIIVDEKGRKVRIELVNGRSVLKTLHFMRRPRSA